MRSACFRPDILWGNSIMWTSEKQEAEILGSTNALRVLGVKAGLMTFAGDVLKCVLPILLVRQIFSGSDCLPLLAMYTGAGATLGHNYPFYLKFKGGKGIAVLAGLVLSTKLWMVPIPLAALFLWWQSPAMFPQGHFW